jgi:hypothetical protein
LCGQSKWEQFKHDESKRDSERESLPDPEHDANVTEHESNSKSECPRLDSGQPDARRDTTAVQYRHESARTGALIQNSFICCSGLK